MAYISFVFAILFLIAIAGLISGAETSITGVSKAYIYHLSKKGDIRAKRVIKLQEKMSTTIGTILVVNQLILYLIPIISTLFAIKYLTPTETAVQQAVIAVLLLIYAEIFPKMLAIRVASKYALLIAPIVNWIVIVLRPIIFVLERCAMATIKFIGVNIATESENIHSDDELRGAIEMHSSANEEDEVQKKIMLKSILDLEEIAVSHTMVHRKNMFTIDASLSMENIVKELMNCQFSRVPLWKDNPENIIGILKTKTFFRALRLNAGKIENIKIKSLLTSPWYIPETTHLLDQLQNFRKRKEHFALVVDEYGDLMGCITLEDILEEIVGNIDDEYDTGEIGMKLQPDGCAVVDGATAIRDINRQFNWSIPEDDAATIAGYIMHELRKIPDAGQTYILSNFRMEILRRQRNQISLVKIMPITNADELN
jgi:Mg2+/Co2+ transporter CorB